MKLSTSLLAVLGVVVLMAVADGKLETAKEEVLEIRNLLLKAEKEATQLEANGDGDDDKEDRTLLDDTDDDDDDKDDEKDRALLDDADDDDDDESEDKEDLDELEARVVGKYGVKYDRSCAAQFKQLKFAPTCSSKSPKFLKGAVSRRDKRKIVKLHNTLRGKVSPKASNMLKMSWDSELALSSQNWAENCVFEHSCKEGQIIPGKFRFGENLALNYKKWEGAIMAWFNERDNFTFGRGAKRPGQKVGHYTAMVWADSYKIGCGYAECKALSDNGVEYTATHHVCQYGPPGNVGEAKEVATPYKSATRSCGECRKCKKNLCNCRSKQCKETEFLDSKRCKCIETHAIWTVKPDCGR